MGGFFTLQIVVFSIVSSKQIGMALGLSGAISNAKMRTHLVSVDYNLDSYPLNDNTKSAEDSFGRENIKIESRQVYDNVKRAASYDPNINLSSSRSAIKGPSDRQNISAVRIQSAPRKSAVIQTIPRKVRGPGDQSSSTTSSPYERLSSVQSPAKDFGTGEPTTTIVYATSIPTSRTYVNIRPTSHPSTQKYHIIRPEDNADKQATTESPKKVFANERDSQPLEQEKTQLNVLLEKPGAFKKIINSEETPTGTVMYDTAPVHGEQRKRTSYKSIPNVSIQTNEDVIKMPTDYGNSLPYPYHNHKWSNEDFHTRIPTSPQFIYKNMQDTPQGFYRPPPTQNGFLQRYPEMDEYQDEAYRSMSLSSSNYAAQQSTDRQHRAYQPLTIRDFELLLQLLVLRESRISGDVDPCQLINTYPNVNGDGIFGPQMNSNGYLRSRDNNMFRGFQQSSVRLLPPNVREELLYRMLLLALHMQSVPKPMPMPAPQIYPVWSPQYMHLRPSESKSATRQHRGFRSNSSVLKNPVRSVQILGEIE